MGVWTIYVSLCLLFVLNASACQSGWTRFGHRCFKVFTHPLYWKDAELRCLNYGGNLASVHSHKEYAFLKLLISSTKTFWIGGYDAVSEGTWFWSDGSKMNFQLWSPKQPDNLWEAEHCTEMNYGATGQWNDAKCETKLPFVCAIAG